MAITTLANVKLVLGITDSSQDSLITLLIPRVEEDFLVIRNKPFDTIVVEELLGFGDGLEDEFTLLKPPVVMDSEIVFIGGEITQEYSIDYSTGVITFTVAPEANAKVEVTYESQEFYYPTGSELVSIQMIGWLINVQKSRGIKSESLGDHSITYDNSEGKLSYPDSVIGTIKKFASFS